MCSAENKHSELCSCARGVSAVSVCENDKNMQKYDLPHRRQNTSNSSYETHVCHNAQTNKQPDIIPSGDNQLKLSGKEIRDIRYSESCSHPYIVNHLINQPNSILVNNASFTQDQSMLPNTDCTVHMNYNLEHSKINNLVISVISILKL